MADYEPVFIIGAARSGTKFLRDTLYASHSCTRVPYDVGYVWRYGNEGLPHDEIDSNSLKEADIRWIRKNILRLSDRTESRPLARYLIEKSVPNTLRVHVLHRCFPRAKFIQIVRDGRAVTESSMRMWLAPSDRSYLLQKLRYFPWANYRYALWFVRNMIAHKNAPPVWGPRYKGVEEDAMNLPLHVVCAKQWLRSVVLAEQHLATIPTEQVMSISYEDLISDESVIIGLCGFLGITSDDVLTRWQATVRKDNDRKWESVLSDVQLREMDKVFESLPASLRGYVGDKLSSGGC